MKAASFGIDTQFPIINITLNNNLIYYDDSIQFYNFRSSEVQVTLSKNETVIIYRSILYDNVLSGYLNIMKTIFVMILLVLFAIIFENDIKKLVLDPLEIMIEIVEMVEQDPVIGRNAENLQIGIKKLMQKDVKDTKERKKIKYLSENVDKYEVKKIENSIINISALLAICFGEAGGDVIKKNLQKGKEFNPMIEGNRKLAIYGFCDIRQFQSVNEALQERTIIFLNQISEIVHSSIDRFSGATNKNIGEAYLSAWRFEKRVTKQDGSKIITKVYPSSESTDSMLIADQSILGFLQIMIKINSDYDLLNYKNDPYIIAHHDLKDYRVKMGFGLHFGWGIEGAIGSKFKIDASYLSPNVNIAARLQAATKQYGVYILISGELYNLCSPRIKKICRFIDKVAVKGSTNPIKLYTIDVNIFNLPIDIAKKNVSAKKRYERLLRIKNIIHLEGQKEGDLVKYVLNSKYFRRLLFIKRNKNFKVTFDKVIENYISGDWKAAKVLLEKCHRLDSRDGPTRTIYNYIQDFNFTADKHGENEWKGYRSLSSK